MSATASTLPREAGHEGAPAGRSGLLLVCPMPSPSWAGAGRGLYAAEPAFRHAIDLCAGAIRDRVGIDLAARFRDGDADRPASGETSLDLLTQGLLQVGLVELMRAKGVRPNAVLGLSLGEAVAAAAAGILTPTEAMTVMQAAALRGRELPERDVFIGLDVDAATAGELCHAAGDGVRITLRLGRRTVVACAPDDVPAFRALLDRRSVLSTVYPGAHVPYHTDRMAACKAAMLADLAALRPRSAGRTYYAALAGGTLPPTAHLDGLYWYWTMAAPAMFDAAVETALADDFGVVLSLQPSLDGILRQTASRQGRAPEFLTLLDHDRPEVESFADALERLRELGLAERGGPAASPIPPDAPEAEPDGPAWLRSLRPQGKVVFFPEYASWLVLGYEESLAVLRQPDLYTSEPARNFDPVLVGAEPDQHARARRILAPLFRTAQSPAFEARIVAIIDRALDGIEASDPADLARAFADPVANAVAGRFIGLTETETARLQDIMAGVQLTLDFQPELHEFFKDYASRTGPDRGDLLLNALVGGDGERFSLPEALSILSLFWVAATATTSMAIASSVGTLLYQPHVRAEIRTRSDLIPTLMEEVLRLTPPVERLPRRASRATTLGDVAIPEGAMMIVMAEAAHHDPALLDDPGRFILHRRKRPHLGFGAGIHQCIGAGMGRLVVRHAVERLLARFPDIRPAVPYHHLHRSWGHSGGSLDPLPCQLREPT